MQIQKNRLSFKGSVVTITPNRISKALKTSREYDIEELRKILIYTKQNNNSAMRAFEMPDDRIIITELSKSGSMHRSIELTPQSIKLHDSPLTDFEVGRIVEITSKNRSDNKQLKILLGKLYEFAKAIAIPINHH